MEEVVNTNKNHSSDGFPCSSEELTRPSSNYTHTRI